MRLFVGIGIPDAVAAELRVFQNGLSEARWVPRENLHVTLRFVGEATRAAHEDLVNALAAIHLPAFDLQLDRLGSFDKGGKVNAVWAGVTAEPTLSHLQQKVERAAVSVGFEPERRKFKPHATLARMNRRPDRQVARWLEQQPRFDPLRFDVDCFHLYRSHLREQGPHYEILETFDLENSFANIVADWSEGA